MRGGYIRTSKKDQNPEVQRDALETSGCERIFAESISSRKEKRQQLKAALDYCRSGDALVVVALDRLARSLKELITLVSTIEEKGVELVSLRESLDTTTPGGKLLFHVFGAVAEFERDLIRERTMAGLEAARARGRNGGRPKKLDEKKLAFASKLLRDKETPIGEICEAVGVSSATLYRHLNPDGTPKT
jgi:DNA invertase Pin-like site-specific DNA recombinase